MSAVIDARGHRCPVPTLMLRRGLERAAPGERLLLVADDPLAKIDVPHFAAERGCHLLGIEEEAGELRFSVEVGPTASDAAEAAAEGSG